MSTLEKLLEIKDVNLKVALTHAANLVAAALDADKVDSFLYCPMRDTLIALGSSAQPLTALQRKHGLDMLPLANGGRVVEVYRSGKTFFSGAIDQDTEEIRGVREILQVRSAINVPLMVGGALRGVVSVSSQKPSFWNQDDARFAEAVAGWVGTVAHRAELVEEIERNATVQTRRAVAEELMTILAHDLRSYLSPVDMRLHLLQRRADAQGKSEDVAELGLARKGLGRITKLIADILDVARIDQGGLTIESQVVELGDLVKDLAAAMATPQQHVDVIEKDHAVVSADPARIRQCLQNIIANAIKFSPKGAPVAVVIERESREDGELAKVQVIDQGPGIPSEVLPHLFDRFVTAGPKGKGGLGIGLFLAKRIAQMHGGDLTAASSSAGACFEVQLPAVSMPNGV